MSYFKPVSEVRNASAEYLHERRQYVYDKVCAEIAEAIKMATLVGLYHIAYKLPDEPAAYNANGANASAQLMIKLQRTRTYEEQVRKAMQALEEMGYGVKQLDSATWNISWQK